MIPLMLAVVSLLPSPGDEVVARAGDVEFQRDEYAQWLVDRVGAAHIHDFVVERVLLRMAGEHDVLPTDEEVEEAFDEERSFLIERYFRGDPERWEADLRAKGIGPQTHHRKRTQEIRIELCLDRLARRARTIGEDALRRRFDEIYGDLRERVTVDVLFYNAYEGLDPDAERPDIRSLKARASRRADEAATKLRAGRGHAELLPDSDPVASDFVHDGRIVRYTKNLLGPEVDEAVASLDRPGQVAGPVMVWDGYYVVQLVGREPVTFEEVRDELEELMRSSTPTSEELAEVRNEAIETYGAEVILGQS